jgi:hypothetical protein
MLRPIRTASASPGALEGVEEWLDLPAIAFAELEKAGGDANSPQFKTSMIQYRCGKVSPADSRPRRGNTRALAAHRAIFIRPALGVVMNVKFFSLVVVLAILVGGVAFLSIWQPSAQRSATEIPVPNERLSFQ